jgi:lysozyme
MSRSAIYTLALSASLLVGVVLHEGYRDTTYYDSVGVPTIGPGRTEGVKPGQRTTVERELVLLLNDLDWRKREIAACVKVPLYQWELDAAMSLAYNIGVKAFCGSTMVKRWNAGDYAGGCAEIKRWVYAGGKKLRGLVTRREAEYRLCMGQDPAAAEKATVER